MSIPNLGRKLRGDDIRWACVLLGHKYLRGIGDTRYHCQRPGCHGTIPASTIEELRKKGFDV